MIHKVVQGENTDERLLTHSSLVDGYFVTNLCLREAIVLAELPKVDRLRADSGRNDAHPVVELGKAAMKEFGVLQFKTPCTCMKIFYNLLI